MTDRILVLREALWDRKKSQIPDVRPVCGRIFPGLFVSGGGILSFSTRKSGCYERLPRSCSVRILVSSPLTMAPREIMRRLKGRTSSQLCEEFPHIRKGSWGSKFWPGCTFCDRGQRTEERIQQCLEPLFEPRPNDEFRMEGEKTRRKVHGYPDFQSARRTRQLDLAVGKRGE